MINWSDGLSRTVGSCTLQHHDDVRPDDELLLGCILHALPDLEREDDQAEGEEGVPYLSVVSASLVCERVQGQGAGQRERTAGQSSREQRLAPSREV